jgi:hypothetical protein
MSARVRLHNSEIGRRKGCFLPFLAEFGRTSPVPG